MPTRIPKSCIKTLQPFRLLKEKRKGCPKARLSSNHIRLRKTESSLINFCFLKRRASVLYFLIFESIKTADSKHEKSWKMWCQPSAMLKGFNARYTNQKNNEWIIIFCFIFIYFNLTGVCWCKIMSFNLKFGAAYFEPNGIGVGIFVVIVVGIFVWTFTHFALDFFLQQNL